ncbi:hypothetical protein [Kangiella sp. HZ709]|uniref:hypothetical protein n=1 Tax=Kangiella sp. HZ709 TaxID=2666328 RepID=UPI0012AF7EB1|nr:hypothetical protein [Kangiella sp. HZ709]MRX26866.1 hypothetical protein [Kangiella sp. HZ709]
MHISELCSNRHNIKFIRRAAQLEVDYIIIGGAAIYYHGGRHLGGVDDIDIYIRPSLENIKKLTHVFQFFDMKLVSDPEKMLKPYARLAIKTHNVNMDIITPREFEPFDELLQRAHIFSPTDPFVRILSKQDLVVHKENAVENTRNRLAVHQKDLDFLVKTNKP